MMPEHHLTEPLLLAYAAGSLPQAFAVVAATHVSLCDQCRAALAAHEAAGGALLEAVEAVEMAPGALAAVLARAAAGDAAPGRERPRAAPPPGPSRLFPAPLRETVGGDLEAVRWRPCGGGVAQAILIDDPAASLRLLRIPGGKAVPDHGHRGTELTLVLQGAFSDAAGRFSRGDVEVADESLHHRPTAEPGPACICLVATEGRLRFDALLPRLLQGFLRI
jgi:putative transcriptional regulator